MKGGFLPKQFLRRAPTNIKETYRKGDSMKDLTRRDAIKLVAASGIAVAATSLAPAADSKGKEDDKEQGKETATERGSGQTMAQPQARELHLDVTKLKLRPAAQARHRVLLRKAYA